MIADDRKNHRYFTTKKSLAIVRYSPRYVDAVCAGRKSQRLYFGTSSSGTTFAEAFVGLIGAGEIGVADEKAFCVVGGVASRLRRPGTIVYHIVALKHRGVDSPENMRWQITEEAKRKIVLNNRNPFVSSLLS